MANMDWSKEFGINSSLKQNFARSEQEFSAQVEQIKDLLQLSPADVLLDIGCNTGQYEKSLSPFVSHITGVDSSPVLIRQTQVLANVTFLVADAMRLPLGDKTFDKTLMVSTLQYIPDPAKAIEEMRRVTKKTILFLNIPDKTQKESYFDGINKLNRSDEEKETIRQRNNAVHWFDRTDFTDTFDARPPFFGALISI